MINIQNFIFYFCLGILFIEGLPILEAIITLIVSFFQMLQGFIAIVATKQQAIVTKIKTNNLSNQSSTRTIGFSIGNDDVDEEDEDF